jgi:alpha-L-rhamnosidase
MMDKQTFFKDAGWIWYDHVGYDDVNTFMLARKEFHLDALPKNPAVINITADSRYKLYVNGNYVCYGPARGYPESYPFDTVDITGYLKKGGNVIAVLVHQYGHGTYQSIYAGAEGLLVEGRTGDVDIGTGMNSGYLVKKCSGHRQDMLRRTVQMNYQENYDARLIEKDWMLPGAGIKLNENGWKEPVWRKSGCAPWFGFEEREIPLLKEEVKDFKQVIFSHYGNCSRNWEDARNLTAVYIEEKKSGQSGISKVKNLENMFRADSSFSTVSPFHSGKRVTMIVDFGEEVAGFLGVAVEGNGGEVLDFTTAELLDGRHLCVQDTATGCKVTVSDRYTLRKGLQNFETFAIHGFRYLALTVRQIKKPLKIIRLYVRQTSYPFENKTVFETSDDSINKIWEMCIRTQICCSLDAYVDCPWREQAQWWGDARVQGANTYYAFGDMRLFRRGIKQAGQSQISNGLTFGHFPTTAVGCILPDFTMTWIHTHLDYYRYTGNISLMREQYDRMEKSINFFYDYTEKNYLLGKMPEWWVFLDWAPLYKEGFSCLFNLLYLNTLRTMAEISFILNKKAKEKFYLSLASDLEKKIRKVFWDKKEKVFWDGYDTVKKRQIKKISQHVHTWAILLDLNKNYHRMWADKILIPPMKPEPSKHPDIVEGSPFYYYYIIEALKKVGGYEKIIVDFIKRRWGMMLDKGATTCWEIWNPEPGYSSLCHAWSAHPIVHFVEIIGGIRPVSANWKEIEITPNPLNFDSMNLSIKTAHGNIGIEVQNGRFKADIPRGIKVRYMR